jgi:hypothetical protein
MAEVSVEEQAPGTYAVAVNDGRRTTTHTVRVPAGLPATLGCAEVSGAELVRCSFAFLLEREPPSSILATFSLEQISDYFPDYPQTIRRMLRPDAGGPDGRS